MNELIFFIQTILIIGFSLGALRIGKEALVAWISIQALIANLFVLKQITLFGLDVTASDSFAIGSLLALNMLQEHFSREEANKATKICFFCMIFFVFASQLHLIYHPNAYDTSQSSFETLLNPAFRLIISSMGVFFIVQQIDIRIFAFLKKSLTHVNFAFRTGLALIVSQLFDTILFSFAGLYGIVESVIDIMIMSFLIKLIVICFATTFLRASKNFLRFANRPLA